MDSVWLRIRNAVPGQLVTPITIATLNRERPSTLASTIASGRNGITRNHSVSRNRISPIHPSKKPDASPIRVPITIEIAVANSPTNSEIRDPQISRVSTDRPVSSVPSGYSADGGSSTPPVALVTSRPSGLASSGANTATNTKRVSSTSPNTPARFDRNRRHVLRAAAARRRRVTCRGVRRTSAVPLLMPDPWAWSRQARPPGACGSCPHPGVQQAVDQVGAQVRGNDRRGGDQERPLQHPVVRDLQRLAGQQAQAGDRKHRLDGDRSGDHEADVDRGDRRGRQQRIADGVVPSDGHVAKPFRTRGRQVVLAELVEQRGAHHQ